MQEQYAGQFIKITLAEKETDGLITLMIWPVFIDHIQI